MRIKKLEIIFFIVNKEMSVDLRYLSYKDQMEKMKELKDKIQNGQSKKIMFILIPITD